MKYITFLQIPSNMFSFPLFLISFCCLSTYFAYTTKMEGLISLWEHYLLQGWGKGFERISHCDPVSCTSQEHWHILLGIQDRLQPVHREGKGVLSKHRCHVLNADRYRCQGVVPRSLECPFRHLHPYCQNFTQCVDCHRWSSGELGLHQRSKGWHLEGFQEATQSSGKFQRPPKFVEEI